MKNKTTWGTCKPRGINRIIYALVRIGLGHGSLKKVFKSLWRYKSTRPVDISLNGIKLRCQLGTNNIENKLVLSSKTREKEELVLLQSVLKDGGVFVDIGANIGYYSLMATTLGATNVLAFEPNLIVKKRFDFNIRANDLESVIQCFPFAIGPEDCVMPLSVSDNDLGAGTLLQKDVDTEKNYPSTSKTNRFYSSTEWH